MTPIKRARRAKGLSQQQLAAAAEVSQAFISELERGQCRSSPAIAEQIALVLGITETEVLYPERFADVPDPSSPAQ